MRPVEVGFAEPAAFGYKGGEGGGWLIDDVGLGAGGDCAVESVDCGELVELRSFDDGLPAKRIDGVGAGEDAGDRGSVVVVGLCELEGLGVFYEAEGPKGDDGEESEDGPASSEEGLSACAYFAVDESEEGGRDESEEEEEKDDGLEDEYDGAGVPVGVEGKEGADAVVVGPVEQEVAEQGDEGEAIEEAPADGGVVMGQRRWWWGRTGAWVRVACVLGCGGFASGGRARRLRRQRLLRAGCRGGCGSIRDDAGRQRWVRGWTRGCRGRGLRRRGSSLRWRRLLCD